MKKIPESVIRRVKALAEKFSGVDGCWEWPRSRNPQTGYGQLTGHIDRKLYIYTAHRAIFEAVHGIPDGMHVLHKCDNRGCFNPDHLFAGAHRENMIDMVRKGRGGQKKNRARGDRHGSRTKPGRLPRGEANNLAKLTEAQVREILSSKEGPMTLARKFGVGYNAIWGVRTGKTWRHISQVSLPSQTPI